MKLVTKEVENKMPKINETSNQKDPICLVHYFNPQGAGNWFGIEYDKETGIMYGCASIFGDHNDELGDFSIKELEDYRGMFGMSIERDLYWDPKPLSEVKAQFTIKQGV